MVTLLGTLFKIYLGGALVVAPVAGTYCYFNEKRSSRTTTQDCVFIGAGYGLMWPYAGYILLKSAVD